MINFIFNVNIKSYKSYFLTASVLEVFTLKISWFSKNGLENSKIYVWGTNAIDWRRSKCKIKAIVAVIVLESLKCFLNLITTLFIKVVACPLPCNIFSVNNVINTRRAFRGKEKSRQCVEVSWRSDVLVVSGIAWCSNHNFFYCRNRKVWCPA